jgi:predicted MFS family arabinose efflux permease
MASDAVSNSVSDIEQAESWLPMIAIALGQALMSFNVASLPVAIGGMVHSFNVPPTTVATGIVMYSLAVAGLVMLGAKLNQRYGSLRVFRTVVVLFGIAQVLMTFSPTATIMLIAQLLSGTAGAALVPSLVALIANNYHGRQQATALGALGARWRRRRRVSDRRHSGHLHRLAPGLRHPDRTVGAGVLPELPAQARSGTA